MRATRLSVANYNTTLSSDSLESGPAVRIHSAPPTSPSPFTTSPSWDRIPSSASDCLVRTILVGFQCALRDLQG
jgi:hypothetical protein